MSAAGAEPRARLVASVIGYVQGVGFRWFVQREADRLGLAGWVANIGDGSVEVIAEGRTSQIDELVDALRSGPAGASVRAVEVRMEPWRGNLVGFEIRSGAHHGD